MLSIVFGVGHEPYSVPEVRGADARSRQNRRPAGVTNSLQVIENGIKPCFGSLAFNLFSKDDWRTALADEVEPNRPQVPVVREASFPASLGEGLTGTGPCPDWQSRGPTGKLQGKLPAPDASEEMNPSVSHKFFWFNLPDIPDINDSF
jgi:hypothetical protein